MGSGKDCLKKPSQYCNGPLDSGSQYRLVVYVEKVSSVIRGEGRVITQSVEHLAEQYALVTWQSTTTTTTTTIINSSDN